MRKTIFDNGILYNGDALACMQTGRRFIGVELSEAYFDLTSERIQCAGQVATSS